MGIFRKFFEKLKYTFKRTELNDDFYDELTDILISCYEEKAFFMRPAKMKDQNSFQADV